MFFTLAHPHPPLWRINQLSDICTEADGEADRGDSRNDDGAGRGLRMARVKLETHPFNKSNLRG